MQVRITPTLKQYKAYQHLNPLYLLSRFILFGGGAGGAKSWLGCEWLIQMAMCYPDTKWFIGREELKRLMQSTYITFLKVCKHHGISDLEWSLNGQYNFIEFKNGSRIDLLDVKFMPRDPMYERFGSIEYTGGWLEEVGEQNFGAFDVLKSRVGRHLNRELKIPPKMLLTCNPKKNWVYKKFYKPWKENKLPDGYVFIQALAKDNPYIDPAYIEMLKQLEDPSKKQRLFYGNWEYDDDDTKLFNYNAICDMWTNRHVEDGKKYITCDVARLGSDWTVIFVWSGFRVIKIVVIKKSNLKVVDKKLTELKNEYGVMHSNIIVDEDGVGGGLVDFGGYRGFVNNSKARNGANYANLKTQCYFEIAKLVNEGKVYCCFDEPEYVEKLIEDLEHITDWNSDSDNQKIQMIPKKEIKSSTGRSTDFSDPFAMRYAFVLEPSATMTDIDGMY